MSVEGRGRKEQRQTDNGRNHHILDPTERKHYEKKRAPSLTTHTHKHTYTHTYKNTYTHTHIHTYIHTYTHTYIRTYIHTRTYTHTHKIHTHTRIRDT